MSEAFLSALGSPSLILVCARGVECNHTRKIADAICTRAGFLHTGVLKQELFKTESPYHVLAKCLIYRCVLLTKISTIIHTMSL